MKRLIVAQTEQRPAISAVLHCAQDDGRRAHGTNLKSRPCARYDQKSPHRARDTTSMRRVVLVGDLVVVVLERTVPRATRVSRDLHRRRADVVVVPLLGELVAEPR